MADPKPSTEQAETTLTFKGDVHMVRQLEHFIAGRPVLLTNGQFEQGTDRVDKVQVTGLLVGSPAAPAPVPSKPCPKVLSPGPGKPLVMCGHGWHCPDHRGGSLPT